MNETVDPTLLAEREHLDKSRVALGHMRKRTEAIGDNAGDELTAFALGRLRRQRLADLADRPDTPLFFGRLRWPAEDYHIGRRHVVDERGNPMVLDWRAPLSRTFYQASVRKPMDVNLRRRFGFVGGNLTSLEDEHLGAGDELGESSAILATEIERPRVGPMRDIVATIQPEQDDLVRADLATTICVQGAPGTGKTAVGLHRAAYLLYAFREQLRRTGVLIVGPNTAFMSYIDNVLPTLGEVDVTQVAVDELTDTLAVRGHDSPETARLKHDDRMAAVLHRAVWGHVRLPEDSLMIAEGGWRWRLGTEYLRKTVEDARADDIPYLTGRERVRAQIVAGLQRQVELRSGDSPGETWTRRMGRHKLVKAFLDEIWPDLDAKRLLARLLTDTGFRAECGEGILTGTEQDLLAARTKVPRYTLADAVLADEIDGLLQRPAGFGHVVVDEAQDLSAMQCRAIARRSTHGSITVLGDLAQGTSPWTAADWAQSLAHLGKPDGQIVALTTGFRVPAAVLALANRLLPSLEVDVPVARSLRTDGLLEVTESADLETDVAAAIDTALTYEGSVGVIAADAAIEKLRERLGDDDRVELVPASLAKGLEFDHVIVAEPAAIVAAEPLGLRRLYVVLTRAVSRLTVVHAQPLPPQLEALAVGGAVRPPTKPLTPACGSPTMSCMPEWTIKAEPVGGGEIDEVMRRYIHELAHKILNRAANDAELRHELGSDAHRGLAPPHGVFLVARGADDGFWGCVGVRLLAQDPPTAEIKRMFVHPAGRGAGLGRGLLLAAEDSARALGAKRMVCETNTALTEARALYTRYGYVETGPYEGGGRAEHWYAKSLT